MSTASLNIRYITNEVTISSILSLEKPELISGWLCGYVELCGLVGQHYR